MCLLIAELIMLAGGLYALIKGRLKLTGSLTLEGRRARIAGLFLISPIPLALAIGFLMGFLAQAGVLPVEALGYAGIVEIALVFLALGGVVVYGYATRPKDEVAVTDQSSTLPPAP
jgi:hypothetical protein